MNTTERRHAEDKILRILEPLTEGEKAIIYKQLNASGFTVSECARKIASSPPSAPEPAVPASIAPTTQPPDLVPDWGDFI